MKLAISNIAWNFEEEPALLPELHRLGVRGIEVAPTKAWPKYEGINERSVEQYRNGIENEGLTIPSMQAIFFGKPELQFLFPETRQAFKDHVKLVADIAAGLHAGILVFGAPKNRRRFDKTHEESFLYAVDFLREIGEICLAHDTCFAWEPNPVEYGCDFITNPREAALLISKVAHPGVGLHLDSGGSVLCQCDLPHFITWPQIAGHASIAHFHASEPYLDGFEQPQVDHAANLKALMEIGYEQWVSIEMKRREPVRQAVETAVSQIKSDIDV